VVKQNPEVDPEFLEAVENVIATVEGVEVVLTRAELTKEGQAAMAAIEALGLKPDQAGVNRIAERVAQERALGAAIAGVVHSNPNHPLTPTYSRLVPMMEPLDRGQFPGTADSDIPTIPMPTNPYPRRNG